MNKIVFAFMVLFAFSVSAAEIPDNKQTPGVVATTDINDICGKVGGKTYTQRHRSGSVEASLHCPKGWQSDHRCPLAIGCADVVKNLWCQPGNTKWNWQTKDLADTEAWRLLCHEHKYSSDQIQRMFTAPTDWRDTYCRFYPNDEERCSIGK